MPTGKQLAHENSPRGRAAGSGDRPPEQTTIQVAVYWPNEGYGIPAGALSMDEARRKAAEWKRLGYATEKSEIHIIETTRRVTVQK